MRVTIRELGLLLAVFASAGAQAAGCFLKNYDDGRQRRTAWVCPPSVSVAEGTRVPMVLAFHGRSTDADPAYSFLKMRGLHRCWPEAVVVYVNAYEYPVCKDQPTIDVKTWQTTIGQRDIVNYQTGVYADDGKPLCASNTIYNKDLIFVDSLAREVATTYRVDGNRIYAAGHSAGAPFIGLMATYVNRLQSKAPFAEVAYVVLQPEDDFITKAVPVNVHVSLSPNDNSTYGYMSYQRDAVDTIRAHLQISNGTPLPTEPITAPKALINEVGALGHKLQIYVHEQGHQWPLKLASETTQASCPLQSKLVTDFFKF